MPTTETFITGKAMYIFKRSNVNYYLANSTLATKCGGGTGGGTGDGGGNNVVFSPRGNWRIIIADTANSHTVVYDSTIRL